jgi:hypothetical protein
VKGHKPDLVLTRCNAFDRPADRLPKQKEQAGPLALLLSQNGFSIGGPGLGSREMVSAIPNPALEAFVALVAPELVFAEVLFRQTKDGFDVRHVADRDVNPLRSVSLAELHGIAQFTERKTFRPLKSAPNLPRGWQFLARNHTELDDALRHLYPGAVADWFAARQSNPPITHYREFTARQTGMYRITTLLDDEQAAQVARACCHRRFCLKQRLWTVEGLPPDGAAEKSLIPCLEPCAILLEFARTAVRLEQNEPFRPPESAEEREALAVSLAQMARSESGETREADFSAPGNPRRAQWLLEKLKPMLATKRTS